MTTRFKTFGIVTTILAALFIGTPRSADCARWWRRRPWAGAAMSAVASTGAVGAFTAAGTSSAVACRWADFAGGMAMGDFRGMPMGGFRGGMPTGEATAVECRDMAVPRRRRLRWAWDAPSPGGWRGGELAATAGFAPAAEWRAWVQCLWPGDSCPVEHVGRPAVHERGHGPGAMGAAGFGGMVQ